MAGKKKKKKHRFFWFAFIQFGLILLVLAALAYYFFGGYAEEVQDMKTEAASMVRSSSEETFRKNQTSVVYAADGSVISTLKGEKDSYYVSIEEIPVHTISAIISIEDKKFYQHKGIDYKALLRALKAMIENGEVKQGGSTITMQLARNIFLNQEKSWQRKVEEMFIAQNLEEKYSKEQILEFYLNNIYFGNGYYGIQAASIGYFNRKVENLSLSEQAFLCAIPNNPTLYDPLTNMDNTLARRDRILKNMLDDGKISEPEYRQAIGEEIRLERPPEASKNDYVETYAYYCATRALMEQEGFVFRNDFADDSDREAYDEEYAVMYSECQKQLYTGGYRIYTSLNLDMQEKLQQAVDNTLQDFTEVNDEGVYTLQSAAVCIDNETGYVKAIVGGRSQDFSGYTLNRAYQSFRQPGSAIKPLLVYTPMFERNYTPDTIVIDQPIEDGPRNANGTYLGEVTVRYAVEHSINTIAWQLYDELTPAVGLSYLKEMNFSKIDEEDYRLPSALGGFTRGTSALEMASGYATLENDGVFRNPTCIVKILDSDENPVYISNQTGTLVYRQNAARTMTDVLTGVMTEGTARRIGGLGEMPCAGKTGTTNDSKDGWFVGYTRYYTTSVWVGYDMPKKLSDLQGASYPGTIWKTFMEEIHEGLVPMDFLKPVELTGDYKQNVFSDDKKENEEEKTEESGEAAPAENQAVNPAEVPVENPAETPVETLPENQLPQQEEEPPQTGGAEQ